MIQRSFIPGDKWLYYKIYTGYSSADIILKDAIFPITEYLLSDKLIKQWFFIRYSDPNFHLRVRFLLHDQNRINEIIHIVHKKIRPYSDKDLLWRIQIDTYNRELERYGTQGMILSEELFFYDSIMIIKFLNLIEGDEGEEIRWLFAIKAIDDLMCSFKFEDQKKLQIFENLKIAFGNEFGMNRTLKKQLDSKYRVNRKKIEDFLKIDMDDSEYSSINSVLNEKRHKTKPIVARIIELSEEKKLDVGIDNLITSYIHMLMNRLFRSQNRFHEMVIYDFLFRTYKSIYACQSL